MAEITQKYGMQKSEQDRVSNANVTHERHTVCVSGRQDFCVLLKLIFPRPLPGLGCSDPEAMLETTAIVPVFLDDRGLDYSHTVFASEPYPNHCFHMTRFLLSLPFSGGSGWEKPDTTSEKPPSL